MLLPSCAEGNRRSEHNLWNTMVQKVMHKGGNTMKTKRVMICLGLLIAGFLLLNMLLSPVFGQSNRRFGRQMRGHTFGLLSSRLLNALELTQEQQAQIGEIKNNFRETLRTIRSKTIPIRTEITDKLLSPDSAAVEDLASQISQLSEFRDTRLQEGLKVALEVRDLLTPEQLVKAAEIRARMRELRGEIRGLYQGSQ